MLRAVFLGYALLLPALSASAITGQLENSVANNAQIPLGHHDDYRLVCHGISHSISPASQVFYPRAVFAFLQLGILPLMLTLRHNPICGRYGSLVQFELTDISVLRAAWHGGGPRLDRS